MPPRAHLVFLIAVALAVPGALRAQDARALSLETKARARDASLLSFRGHAFHPEIEPSLPPTLPELLAPTTSGATEIRIVQSSLRPAESRAQLAAAGVEILERVPNSGWLVRVASDQVVRLARLPGVTWSGPMLPAHVVLPEVLARVHAEPASLELDPDGRVPLRLDFLPGVDARLAEPLLRALPGVEVRELATPDEHAHAARLGVNPSALRASVIALARVDGASALMTDDAPRRHADDTIWSLQTGIDHEGTAHPDYDVSAKLWARGITGEGMLIGIADDGLENDNCMFRYGPELNEACWPLGPSSDAADRLPAERPMPDLTTLLSPKRSRDRKVVAYFLQRNATEYSSVAQHGTTVASIALGDDYASLAARPRVRDLGMEQLLPGHQPAPTWFEGQRLRPDLVDRVDDPTTDDPGVDSSYGSLSEHHQLADGIAPGAQLVFHDVGDGPNLVGFFESVLLAQSHDAGATTFNASFGGRPCASCYAGGADDVDRMTHERRDLVVVASAGNDGLDGTGTIGLGFAHAKNALVIGASAGASAPSIGTSRPGEDIMDLSSRGPRSGGMLAPDLVAPGELDALWPWWDTTPEDGQGRGDGDCGGDAIRRVEGTSFAAPAVTGAAALVQQYFMDGYYPTGAAAPSDALRPTGALVRAVLINSARDLQGLGTGETFADTGHRPSFGQGWGAPRLDDTLYFAGDPTLDDPRGDTERAGFVVLTDTPNGCLPAAGDTLALEPGGLPRDAIVASFRPALRDGEIHESIVDVKNPDPSSPANELRFTLAWNDPAASSGASVILERDLDLEVVSPGPNGVLESTRGARLGDDVVYRPDYLTAWAGGFTVPSPVRIMQRPSPPFTDFADREMLNTVENVFISSADVVPGQWIVRVIGYRIAPESNFTGFPNFVDGDRPPDLDMDGDTNRDRELKDLIDGTAQGYALIASGSVSAGTRCLVSSRLVTTHGPEGCIGDVVTLDASSSGLNNCVGPAEYRFESPIGTPVPGGDWTTTSALDLALTAPGVVDVVVRVRCSSDPSCASVSVPLRFDVRPTPTLDFPGPVTVSVAGDCRLRVSWSAAVSSAGPLVYDVYRDSRLPVARDAAHRVATGFAGTTWLDDVAFGAPVAYRVVARVECNEAANAGGDSPLTAPFDATAPRFGGIGDARGVGACQVEVSWDESTALDACSGIAGFDVYRDAEAAHAGQTLVASLVPASPLIDSPPFSGSWTYVVRAVNGSGLDDGNLLLQQEAVINCMSGFPRDAALDQARGPSRGAGTSIDLQWQPSPDEGGPFPVTYSIVRGTINALHATGYDHALVTPDACGIAIHELDMPDQVDGIDYYYLVVPVSGGNATFGYDSSGREIAATTVCE